MAVTSVEVRWAPPGWSMVATMDELQRQEEVLLVYIRLENSAVDLGMKHYNLIAADQRRP
jgi:hypothetical protein